MIEPWLMLYALSVVIVTLSFTRWAKTQSRELTTSSQRVAYVVTGWLMLMLWPLAALIALFAAIYQKGRS